MKPLEGIKVVSLEQAIAAPFASRQLGELGARVIKVERPGVGDFARAYDDKVRGMSSQFMWTNRSKESITLDLKEAEGLEVLKRLLADADVFIQNLAPGAIARLGLSDEVLRAEFPQLIICHISGYGRSGPYANKKAYDLLVQCELGVPGINGTPGGQAKIGIAVADIATGMYAYSGILTSLIQRGRTGKGVIFEVSLFDALAEWMSYPIYYQKYGGVDLPRTGTRHSAISPYGPFKASDGKEVFLGIQNEREWKNFCDQVLLAPQVATDPRFINNSLRVVNRDALEALVAQHFQRFDSEQAIARLESAGIANARLNSIMELLSHPQFTQRGRWRQVDSPVGPVEMLLPPVTSDDFEPQLGAVPAVGQHTDSVLAALGFDSAAIAALRDKHII
ncbi:CaiB/BaiF CoA transferase family protein [Herbaspirillum lusitanum]|uniref:CaiB/BaiF CoA transferase family protein n=1 Tax=Herbaspirillum lusitanum TaxID=213312 RepID=UPI000368E8D9|nr:CaiB/BaiF CoA-transferase family protein [Herbaspirillum lusitanum]